MDTTVGRALLFDIVPDGLSYDWLTSHGQEGNLEPDQTCYRDVGLKETVIFADQLMYTGYDYRDRFRSSRSA